MIRTKASALTMTMISACSDAPEIAACQDFLKGGLRSPSTYSEVSVRSEDLPMPAENLARYQLADRSSPEKAGVRTVSIVYDAANAYGTPVRGVQTCHFLLKDREKGTLAADVEVAATIAGADRALGQRADCCLPPLTGEAANEFGPMGGNMSIGGNMSMGNQQ